jgi:hypothetical protein
VHLEASTKPHVHQKFEIFWTNIASTMACPMSKNWPKKGLRPLGVKIVSKLFQKNSQLDVESELNHKKIGKMYMRQSFLHPTLKFLDYFLIQLF